MLRSRTSEPQFNREKLNQVLPVVLMVCITHLLQERGIKTSKESNQTITVEKNPSAKHKRAAIQGLLSAKLPPTS